MVEFYWYPAILILGIPKFQMYYPNFHNLEFFRPWKMWKYSGNWLDIRISLGKGIVFKMFLWRHISNWNRPQSCRVYIAVEFKPKPWYNCLELVLDDYVMHGFLNFSWNMNLTGLLSVLLEIWYLKFGFEYRTIFKRYYWEQILEEQFWSFNNFFCSFIYFRVQKSETPKWWNYF